MNGMFNPLTYDSIGTGIIPVLQPMKLMPVESYCAQGPQAGKWRAEVPAGSESLLLTTRSNCLKSGKEGRVTQMIGLQETLASLGENVDLGRDLIMLQNVFIDLFVHPLIIKYLCST